MTALELYAAIEAKGSLLTENGLCNDIALHMDGYDCLEHCRYPGNDAPNVDLISMFRPTASDEVDYQTKAYCFWGGDPGEWDECRKWTDMRKNLLLFVAAMRGEL